MEKTDKEQKSEMIRKIAETIDSNTNSLHDVWAVLHTLQDAAGYLEDKRCKYRTDLPYLIRSIREKLQDEKRGIQMIFDDLTDDLQEAIMSGGENAEGLILINSEPMKGALIDISDEYNS